VQFLLQGCKKRIGIVSCVVSEMASRISSIPDTYCVSMDVGLLSVLELILRADISLLTDFKQPGLSPEKPPVAKLLLYISTLHGTQIFVTASHGPSP
jgi:hypothetical protein